MEQISTTSKASAGRYSYKQFDEFKKPVELDSGFNMYVAKPHKQTERKKPKRKVKAAPSNRSARTDVKTEPSKSRTMGQSRREIFALCKLHPKVTLDVGSLSANIGRALPQKKLGRTGPSHYQVSGIDDE
jgi:hypothetical protein